MEVQLPIDAPPTTKSLSDSALMTMVRMSRRSWWIGLYRDGSQCAEYDTLTGLVFTPLGLGRTSRWEEVSKRDMISLRLLCPNGEIGQLDAPEGHKFFQLKCGGALLTGQQWCDAQVIGVVVSADGSCVCRAWETQAGCLTSFTDNIYAMQYRHIGQLAFDVQGLRL
jgi:hypothetical protein